MPKSLLDLYLLQIYLFTGSTW